MHDLETRERFRAHYLYSGNASESAREVGMPESTGRDLARALLEDAEFVADRRRLRAIEIDECVAARRRVREKSLERFLDEDGGIDVKSFGGDDKSTVVVTDKRHEYGKLVLDAEKNAHSLAKFEAERAEPPDAKPVQVQVILRPTADG